MRCVNRQNSPRELTKTAFSVSIAQGTAQGTVQGQRYIDPLTGINLAKYEFADSTTPNPKLVFGFAVPQKIGATEYIGHVVRRQNLDFENSITKRK
jgi:hypothetical protein